MSDNSFISIRNAIIASVIAGVILLAVPTLRGYIVDLFSWAWAGLVWVWDALLEPYSVPGWAWIIVLFFAIVGLVSIYLEIKGESEEAEFKSYTEDNMRAAKWRWTWAGNQLSNLWCYCPNCDAELVFDESSCLNIMSDLKKTDFICENCHPRKITSIVGGNKDYAISAISREIHRRIRTNEYQKH